jgi:hypothetical protein
MAPMTFLVFPSSVSAAVDFLNNTRSLGLSVIGASSVQRDPNAEKFEKWFALPTVNDPAFEKAFLCALAEYGVARIFCPVNAAHQRIREIIESNRLSITLLPRPFDAELASYKEFNARIHQANRLIRSISEADRELSSIQIAAIFRVADGIWGQCGEDKIAAMMGAMLNAPNGDVVEIGALFGKSAAVLVMLARWLGIGNVLAIDPWAAQSSLQKDAPTYIQDLSQGDYWEDIAASFLINLAPLVDRNFNYIRATSADALPQYESGSVLSQHFGATEFSGRIAVLHIDGNHDFQDVMTDASLWLPKLVPGGWVIFDDYCWSHGDGPKRVADRLLSNHAGAISQGFVCDGALFLKVDKFASFAGHRLEVTV